MTAGENDRMINVGRFSIRASQVQALERMYLSVKVYVPTRIMELPSETEEENRQLFDDLIKAISGSDNG